MPDLTSPGPTRLTHLLACALLLTAQPLAAMEALPEPATATTVQAGATELDEAWRLLRDGTLALAQGDKTRAAALLTELVRRFPGHPAVHVAAPALQALAPAPAPVPGEAASAAEPGEEKPTAAARAELVAVQTIHGFAAGIEICVLADCDDARSTVLTLATTTGLGLGLSLTGSSEGIRPGETAALNSGLLWGTWHGIALQNALRMNTNDSVRLQLASQLAGLGAGAAAAVLLQPRAGQVALANTTGFWSGAVTFLAFGIDRFRAADEDILTTMLIASDIGLGLGAWLATEHVTSRSRLWVIDSGGVLGTLLGMGVAVLFQGNDVEPEQLFAAGLVGAVGGLAGTTYLTRGWDAPLPEMAWQLAPSRDGAMLSLGGRF